jgi:hypothetical protein
MLATYIAKCVRNGVPVFGRYATAKTPVLYLDLENSDYDIKEYVKFFSALGPERIRYYTRSTGVPELASPGLLAFCERYKPLLIFDSLTKFLKGANPFHPGEMSDLFDKLLNLCAAGATIILIHHATRADVERYANSYVIGANVSRAYCVTSHDRPKLHHVTLAATLSRGAEPVTERLIAFPLIADRGMFGIDAEAFSEIDKLVNLVKEQGGETTRDFIKKRCGIRSAKAVNLIATAISEGKLVAPKRGRISVPKSGTEVLDVLFPKPGTDGNEVE